MKPSIFAHSIVFAFGGLSAQRPAWQPSLGHTQVPIWPGAVPDTRPVAGPEAAETSDRDFLIAGRPAVGVSKVTRPTNLDDSLVYHIALKKAEVLNWWRLGCGRSE